jgi:hypothetical protein
LVFGSRQNVWRLRCDDTEAHHDTYDKYANTPKASVEAPHSGREIGGSFTFRVIRHLFDGRRIRMRTW